MPEYINTKDAIITDQHYFNLKEKRGIKVLKIKRTTTFESLQGLEFEIEVEHLWTKVDKLHHLSRKYYGTNDFWWVIGLVNGKPTDGHFKIGDVVKIPKKPGNIKGAI